MNIVRHIALKYLFGRKSSQAIHWITGISMVGIGVGTAALLLVLGVFNGFEELLAGMFSKHNPDIKIVSKLGKNFRVDSAKIHDLKQWEDIQFMSVSLEEVAMFQYAGTQEFGVLLGVSDLYNVVCSADSAIVEGEFLLKKDNASMANMGMGIRNKLGVSLKEYFHTIEVFVPDPGVDFSSAKSLSVYHLQPQSVFSYHNETDYSTIITDLESVQNYLHKENIVSSIELKLNRGVKSADIQNRLTELLGGDFIIKDRYKQDEAFMKIMRLEKWLFFSLFSLTLILVSFTVVGALYMIVLDKRQDISILKSLGMENRAIQSIFRWLGLWICIIGLSLGFAIALIFYFLQKKYGLIGVPEEFIIDSYPIKLVWVDFILVSFTVFLIAWLATVLPARKVGELEPIFREE